MVEARSALILLLLSGQDVSLIRTARQFPQISAPAPPQVFQLSDVDPVSGEPKKTSFTFDGWLDRSNNNSATLLPDGIAPPVRSAASA